MNSAQIKIVLAAIIFVLAAWIVSPLLFSFREGALPLSTESLSFQATEAYRVTQEFVTQFPSRELGSIESRQSTGYIHDYLDRLGYSVSYSHFDARIAGRIQVGRNIRAYKQGQNAEILALVAHMDTARTTLQGAMDNGSGVGVLLEMARVFAANPTNRSLLIIFSDGEEWGMLGARDLAENDPDRSRIAAVLSLDHVGIGDLKTLCLDETGQLQGFTPPWLRRLATSAAETQDMPVRAPSGFSEYLERAILISWADQGPFLSAGIPSINLGSESHDRSREREIYHSPQDTIEKLKVGSIEKYGRTAERIIRSLDEMPSVPRESSGSFRLWDALYIKAGSISVLQIISFLPLLLASWFCLKNFHDRLNGTAIFRELLTFLGTVLPMWTIYLLVKLARGLRLLPLYTLYPAALKDPVLENPPWRVLASIFGIALFVALVCCVIIRYSFRGRLVPDFYASKLVLLALLILGVVPALIYNSYWASFFLLLPAWIWAMAGIRRPGAARAANRILIFAAGIPYYAALLFYGSRLEMGWSFAWYQVLALSNGLFTATAYFLATAMIAIGIRFLAIQSYKSES
jgi:hypothetical protein